MIDKMRAYRDTELSTKAMAVYLYLCDRAGRESKSCFPSIKTISRDLKLSESSVKRSIRELQDRGYIEKEQRFRDNGGKSSNLYRIL